MKESQEYEHTSLPPSHTVTIFHLSLYPGTLLEHGDHHHQQQHPVLHQTDDLGHRDYKVLSAM